jgi:signal transduction histidine kinase
VRSAQDQILGQWDSARLRRVLNNLLGNAVRYSPGGGHITVDLSVQDGMAVLTVADQGVGIPPEDRPHVFERFRRGSNVEGRIAGTGIGLADVLQVVEQHGGTVTVESEVGRGSTFTVRLPLAPAGGPSCPSGPS